MEDSAQAPGVAFQNLQRVVPGVALVDHDIEAEFRCEIELGRAMLRLGRLCRLRR
jgi:hypothetical protein